MFEESPDGFISRWRKHAATVRVFSRTEGHPLLECQVGGAILQTLERSGPYLAPPGEARAIINPTARSVSVQESGSRSIEATGIGRARICGLVVAREDPFLVLDAGASLVVGVEEPLPPDALPGSWVAFEVQPPIHSFVIREPRARAVPEAEAEAV